MGRRKLSIEIKLERKRQRFLERKRYCEQYLGGRCVRCGVTEFLEFDHIERKSKVANVSSLLRGSSSERLRTEVDKCQLLCMDCHIGKTIEETPEPAHGTLSRYGNRYKCRCELCMAANRKRGREYMRKFRLAKLKV